MTTFMHNTLALNNGQETRGQELCDNFRRGLEVTRERLLLLGTVAIKS